MYKQCISLVNRCTGEGGSVLDIGYGNGYLIQRLDRLNRAYDLYGIDISNDMLAAAEARNSHAKQEGRLHLQVGDCCSLPFEGEMFDAVTSVNTVYFWSDAVKGLMEIRRCLKPGGQFINVVYAREWLNKLSYTRNGFKKYMEEELTAFGKDAGFSNIEIRPCVKGKSYAVVYTK